METSLKRSSSTLTRRSCQTCASAKVKCTQSSPDGNSNCDRCRRLNKECALQPVAERKPRIRKKTTRVAQLEQKLDGLVTLLTAKETAQGNPYQSPESLARHSVVNSPSAYHAQGFHATEDVPMVSSPPAASHSNDPTLCFRLLNTSQIQHYLNLFQENMSAYFPFVVIPSDIDAERLRTEKPTLFGAVVVAASFADVKQQSIFGEKLLQHFIEELLIKGNKSLELLQGLILYISCYTSVPHVKLRMTQLVSLAASLVTDLGLARASANNERFMITMDETKWTYNSWNGSGTRTLEERRVYAGVFYIASTISTCYRELQTIKLTSYLEECCTVLENAAEYPSDLYLVQLTRLQGMVERVSHTFQYGSRSTSPRQVWKVPLYMYIAPFEREFDDFFEKISSESQQNNILMMHYYNARGFLYEIALYEEPSNNWYGKQSFRRMEALFACLQTVKSFFNTMDRIPIDMYYHIPMINWTQYIHCLVNLSKLCFLNAEDWSMTHAREVVDFPNLLEQRIMKFEAARALKSIPEPADESESDMFSRFARRMRISKAKYEKRIAIENRGQTVDGPDPKDPIAQLGDPSANVEMFANLDDNQFWREMMADFIAPPYMESWMQPQDDQQQEMPPAPEQMAR